jgi:hypothetical protein
VAQGASKSGLTAYRLNGGREWELTLFQLFHSEVDLPKEDDILRDFQRAGVKVVDPFL